ncbi:MAG TPA: hypothetical protein VHM70_00360 [Polyangiaceae bacterium]|jgi:hypothetical protein|nr:hypothetical protein [Polyangiaceae bacterium]
MTSLPPPADTYPELIHQAWRELGRYVEIARLVEISATVSTNRVFRVELETGHEVIVKASTFGSYVHFRQDHQLIQQWLRLLGGTRFSRFLAPVLERDGKVFTAAIQNVWLVFYEKAPFYDFLPRMLNDAFVDALAGEMAAFHRASAIAARRMNPSWKSLGSDIAALYDLLGRREWLAQRGFGVEAGDLLRAQCETWLNNAEALGYHQLQKIPVLVDWNIGNFSVGFDGDGFKFFSRWDYDWFRIEPRLLDFYFCARVVRSEGDKTIFTYSADPLFEPAFKRFLRSYHRQFPLEENEVLFLKEAYRFFLLNYVVRSGEHFFQTGYCEKLQREVVEQHLPNLDALDFRRLLDVL